MNRFRKQHVIFVLLLLVPACRQQMADQPAYRPFQPTSFFEDKRSARPLVQGTVARGHLKEDSHFYQGEKDFTNKWTHAASIVAAAEANVIAAVFVAQTTDPVAETFPLDMVSKKLRLHKLPNKKRMEAVLQRGQERFNIYCAVCHDRTGAGQGMIVERGYARPPSYHIPRLRHAPLGHFYRVITYGYGAMPAHAAQIPPADRWAVVAYVRALQFSQNASLADLRLILKRVPDSDEERKQIPGDIRNALDKGDDRS